MKKAYIQCGEEHECKKKDCLKCRKLKRKYNLTLTLAEQVVIEDFAMIDLEIMKKEKPKEIELMQKIMYKVMRKMFKEEKRNENN